MNANMVYYDGHCGMCHGAVKFILRHDRVGNRFSFAPLQGSTFLQCVSVQQRARIGDTLVLQQPDGNLLRKSTAWIYIFRELGGPWGVVAWVLAIVPQTARDFGYDVISRNRYWIWGRKDDLCPIIPSELRSRFNP